MRFGSIRAALLADICRGRGHILHSVRGDNARQPGVQGARGGVRRTAVHPRRARAFKGRRTRHFGVGADVDALFRHSLQFSARLDTAARSAHMRICGRDHGRPRRQSQAGIAAVRRLPCKIIQPRRAAAYFGLQKHLIFASRYYII